MTVRLIHRDWVIQLYFTGTTSSWHSLYGLSGTSGESLKTIIIVHGSCLLSWYFLPVGQHCCLWCTIWSDQLKIPGCLTSFSHSLPMTPGPRHRPQSCMAGEHQLAQRHVRIWLATHRTGSQWGFTHNFQCFLPCTASSGFSTFSSLTLDLWGL